MAVLKPSQLAAAIKKKIDNSNRQTTKTWAIKGAPLLKDLINESLDKGESPVAGAKNFGLYAASTAKKKGKKKPVDLYDTGKLRNSLATKAESTGNISAKFTQRKDVLGYLRDDQGRKALPQDKERFKKRIKEALKALYLKLYKIS